MEFNIRMEADFAKWRCVKWKQQWTQNRTLGNPVDEFA